MDGVYCRQKNGSFLLYLVSVFHWIPDFHERSVSYASLPEELPCVLPGVPQVLPAFPRDAGAAAPRPGPQEGVLTPCRRVLPRGAAPVPRRGRVSGAAALLTGGPALRYTIYIGQHHIIPALRLKHRSGGSPRQEPPQAAVALRSASLRLGVRHGICVAKMLDNTQSIICAFGLASAAPRSPYRHLELCGVAIV